MSDEPYRLLLVEDDPELARAVARILRREGLQVTAAPSCATARALTCRFDIGVFDIGLPDGDGVELAAALLEAAQVDRAVFFTAITRSSTIRRARRMGPLVRKREGAEAVAQVVLGLLGRGAVTRSGFRASVSQPGGGQSSSKKSVG
jgi:DNA-binding response OmpR family regulator